ncbi:putative bifunctional diguanylate cyclase/phosphodiesterase [Neptuniibacter caesariensis]|uniref:cyclic-guanylate-specific phosphodiesterase n=1 Tax=Neptuniibacter caesariensis TaxID=207954 RepID=A0A7U8C8W0_NEPCE|nr:GGDEF domain-containing phosphodiesterase [Neptuniibacter caesariensis]EAR62716.1 Diguanylate cyclase/phosphodiesterase domain 2 (EAL) [Oceanospirillum sp. MED92] [Neptuniibacter caesariensis]
MSERIAELEAENALLKQRVIGLSKAEKVLRETEARYALAMQGANEGLWDWDPVSKELYLSARLLRTIGMGKDTFKTTSNEWLSWVHEEDREHYQQVLCHHLKGETEYFRCEYRVQNSSGGYVWVLAHGMALRNDQNIAYRMVGSIGDITEQKEYQDKLLHQATYDHLTGLPNRALALDRLSVAISRSRRNKTSVGLLFVDLDNFKKINDTLGHEVGDLHLKEISNRLGYCFREEDTIARLGGDEFLVILPDLDSPKQVEEVCERILATAMQPVTINGYEFSTSASIGVTIYPDDGYEPSGLLRNADAAMYQAKAQGKDTFCFFTPEMDQETVRKFTMESYLRQALSKDQLSLHYQSIVSASSGDVVGAEALLRWHCPEYGQVPPDQFIPLAEESGLIVTIGDWVLETACLQAAEWMATACVPFKIAVNVSYPQFRDGHIVSTVEKVLKKSGLPAQCLELELTERLLMEDERGCAEALKKLSAMGVQLSIDDFGTGFSALNYLQRFPVNTLKIDRSFVAELDCSKESPALISAIIQMAHALGIEVVGEGVETRQQVNFLTLQTCDYLQGYHFARPVPADQFQLQFSESCYLGAYI